MQKVADVMDRDVLLVSPDLGVRELARRMLDHDADGACVVENGKLVGVVTSMDLVFREKKVHLPTMVAVLDALIPLGIERARKEIEKVAAADVRHIMTGEPYAVRPDAPVREVATHMVEEHHGYVPVVDDGAIVGAVSRRAMLRATAGR